LAELRTQSKGAWTTYSFLQYDHEQSDIKSARFSVGDQPKDDSRKNIQLGYYLSKNFANRTVDQLTVNVNWPITDRWQIFGSERYSIERAESFATTLGLEYNACCWKLRFVGSNRVSNRRTRFANASAINGFGFGFGELGEKVTSFLVELELTSLGKVRTGI